MKPLLVEYYEELPRKSGDAKSASGPAQTEAGLGRFERQVRVRYSEGTLQRLLDSPSAEVRRATVLALGLVGTMVSNRFLAARLRDPDRSVRRLAAEALWSVWFRGDAHADGPLLRRVLRLRDPHRAVAGLDALVQKCPRFAEAYNQRAILHFRLNDFARSLADCHVTLKLNPYHFGALAGMGQSYVKLKKPQAALKAFRAALHINPGLEGVAETIHFLEEALGEEGRRDDKK